MIEMYQMIKHNSLSSKSLAHHLFPLVVRYSIILEVVFLFFFDPTCSSEAVAALGAGNDLGPGALGALGVDTLGAEAGTPGAVEGGAPGACVVAAAWALGAEEDANGVVPGVVLEVRASSC